MFKPEPPILLQVSDSSAIEAAIDSFEAAYAAGSRPKIADFAPPSSDANHLAIVTELIRIDLERRFASSPHARVEDYRSEHADVFANIDSLSQLAFEEYRLRMQAGEAVQPQEYQRRFNITSSTWPEWPSQPRLLADPEIGTIGGHKRETRRITDAAIAFPEVGDTVESFELSEELGRGAFAHVYLAKQGDLAGRPVVLKVTADDSLEPERLARLQHTNIVPIYSVHRHSGLLAICMPYFGRTTLASSIAERRRSEPNAASVDIPSALKTISQLAAGLAHAHQRGIYHRDIKPANILIADDGRAMLLDFNLSDDVVAGGCTALMVGGTLPYMAPEHLRAALAPTAIDGRSDVFSLGVVMYEMLTGGRPFADRIGAFLDVLMVSIADRQAQPMPPRRLNPTLSGAVASIIEKCLHADPTLRYQTAEELEEDVTRQLADLPLKHANDSSFRERTQKWIRRHPRLASAGSIGVLGAAMLAVLAGLWMLRGQQIAKFEAAETFRKFEEEAASARMALSLPDADDDIVEEGVQVASAALDRYGVIEGGDWSPRPSYQQLRNAQKNRVREESMVLAYLIAGAESDLQESLRWNQRAAELSEHDAARRAIKHQRVEIVARQDGADNIVDASGFVAGAASTPGDSELDQFLTAAQLLHERDFFAAEKILTKLRDERPLDPQYWLLLGHAYSGAGRSPEAEGCYDASVAMAPHSYFCLLSRARSRMAQGKWDAAMADLNRVLQLKPTLIEGLLNRALAAIALKHYQDALKDLDKALQDPRTPTRAYFVRSKVRRLVGDIPGAQADHDQGVNLTPDDELSWNARGMAQLATDPEQALASFRQAYRLNSRSTVSLRNLVHVLGDRLSRPLEALKHLDELLKLDSSDHRALAGRAVTLARLGKFDEALAAASILEKARPEATTSLQIACVYSLVGQQREEFQSEAMTHLRTALRLEPQLVARVPSDPDLAGLRESAAFEELVAAATQLVDDSPPRGERED